jgi:hypothetical protein
MSLSPARPTPGARPAAQGAGPAAAPPGSGRLRPPLLPGRPGRIRELTAALAVAGLLAELVLAPVTLAAAVVLLVTGRLGRWRPAWLAAPAGAGVIAIAAVGAGRAVAGFAAGPRPALAFLATAIGHPGRLARGAAVLAGAGHGLPRQLPVALLLAAVQAAVLSRAARRLAGRAPEYRPGLVAAARRRSAARALSAGAVVTRDGAAIGLERSSGRRAEISWAQAVTGVLAVSTDPQAAARVSFPVAAAAARRRMSVIVVDLTGSSWLADALSGTCVAAAAPLRRLSPAGPAWYEPFRSHPPPRAAALAIKMISWAGLTQRQRQVGQRYLADACAVLTASPPPPAVLDALIALLEPARLRAAAAALPGHLRGREALVQRAAGSAGALEADPALGLALGGQLRRLRASGPGRWLGAPPLAAGRPALTSAGPPGRRTPRAPQVIRLGQAVRDRSCALFSLGPGGEAAAMAGRLAVADLTATLAGLRDQELRGDCLAWVHGCEAIDRPSLIALLGLGAATGTAVLLSTASPAAAASLAPAAGLVVSSGPADQVLAERLAAAADLRAAGRARGAGWAPGAGRPAGAGRAARDGWAGSPEAAAEALRGQAEDEFAIIAPGARFRPGGRSVPAAWARLR